MKYPQHIQFDTFDGCNLTCVYCFTHHPGKGETYQPTIMPLSTIEKLCSQTKTLSLLSIRPYGYGDPLLETRLPKIFEIIRKYNEAPIVIYTNGTTYENRRLLVHPDLAEAHFTISAVTPETYRLVHGKPLLHEAIRTVEWLELQNPHPKITMHFVATRINVHELAEWTEKWARFPQVRSNLHKNFRDKHLDNLTLLDEEKYNLNLRAQIHYGQPCNVWSNFYVNVCGEWQLCCHGLPKGEANFGNVLDTPLLDAWKTRCDNKMQNKMCETCTFRSVDWERRLEEWLRD